jgi:ABC-type Fe3+-hydroxamate transport system substrate-binding protein
MNRNFIDQMGRVVTLKDVPSRIVSLVPSITELLVDLKINVVGRTKFCIHPSGLSTVPIVGGTKKVRFEVIDRLKPDLIIGSKEENFQGDIEQLAECYPIWMSDVRSIYQSYQMIVEMGKIFGMERKSQELVDHLTDFWKQEKIGQEKSVVYLIWQDPFMAVGKDTYINDVLVNCGYANKVLDVRYPEITLERLKILNPSMVMLSTEPYPFRQKHLEALSHFLPDQEIRLVDGEFFSWYGSRVLHIN